MTKLIKLLNVQLMNLEDSMRGRFSNSDFDASTQIRDMIERYKNKEDIEVREYINEEDFYLYNIHTTETSLYVEKYDAVMSFDVDRDMLQECKCQDVTDRVNIIELLQKEMEESYLY